MTALAVLVCVVIPLGLMAGVPAAGTALGILILGLALLRAVLPVEALGALVVRMRIIDVATLIVLGTAVLLLSTTSPNL